MPLSSIFEAYIEYLEELMRLGLGKKGRIATFSVGTIEESKTYLEYYKIMYQEDGSIKEDKDAFKGYKNVLSNLDMKVMLKITLP